MEAKLASMATRIRRGTKPPIYLRAWMDRLSVSAQELANRCEVERSTIYKWIDEPQRLDLMKLSQIADALGLDHWTELTRLPGRPSLDARLKDQPDEIVQQTMEMIDVLLRARKG